MKFALVLLGLFSLNAHAWFLVEPYGGGQFNGSVKVPKQIDDSSFKGLVFGGRAGFDLGGIFLGGEYMADQNQKLKVSPPSKFGSESTTAVLTNKHLGGFLGAEFGSVRLIGTFFAKSKAHLTHTKDDGSVDFDLDEQGYGYKGELGARLARFLTLSVGYTYFVYTKSVDHVAGTSGTNVPVHTQQGVLVMLTVPIDL